MVLDNHFTGKCQDFNDISVYLQAGITPIWSNNCHSVCTLCAFPSSKMSVLSSCSLNLNLTELQKSRLYVFPHAYVTLLRN
jgi:hypothetical protein